MHDGVSIIHAYRYADIRQKGGRGIFGFGLTFIHHHFHIYSPFMGIKQCLGDRFTGKRMAATRIDFRASLMPFTTRSVAPISGEKAISIVALPAGIGA